MVMAPSATTTIEESYGTLSLRPCESVSTQLENRNPAKDGARNSKTLIGDALKKRVENIDEDTCEPGDEDAFFVADMGDIYRQHLRWKKHLKRVRPHYGEFEEWRSAFSRKHTDPQQLSSATLTRRFCACLRPWALALTVRPRPKSNRSCVSEFRLRASFMLNLARPSLISATPPKRVFVR